MPCYECQPGTRDRSDENEGSSTHDQQAFCHIQFFCTDGAPWPPLVCQDYDLRGGKEVTLVPGQTFYEGPNDVHTVGRNASTTEPAKFVVVLLKKKGVDVVLPAE